MKKYIKCSICIILSVLLLITSVPVFAESELGTYNTPYILVADYADFLIIEVAPGESAWVQASVGNALLYACYGNISNFTVDYRGMSTFPNSSRDDTYFCKIEMRSSTLFSVSNFDSSETLTLCLMLITDVYADNFGAIYAPMLIDFDAPWIFEGNELYCNQEVQGERSDYFYGKPGIDGFFVINRVSSRDYEGNTLGWKCKITNTLSVFIKTIGVLPKSLIDPVPNTSADKRST